MDKPLIDSVAGLLARARLMEQEAVDRYRALAAETAERGNLELADFFRYMAGIEQRHVDQVDEMAEALELPPVPEPPAAWQPGTAPETLHSEAADVEHVRGALLLAMAGEEAAVAFFEDVRAAARDESVSRMAADMAAEERHHIALLRKWLMQLNDTA